MIELRRKHIIGITLLFLLSWNISIAQKHDYGDAIFDQNYYSSNKGFRSLEGTFLFRLENELIYIKKNDSMQKSPSYSIMAINMLTKKDALIDSNSKGQCVKCSRNSMLFIKNGIVMKWNTKSKTATTYHRVDKSHCLMGLGYNTDKGLLLLILKEKESKTWVCRLLNKKKQILMKDNLYTRPTQDDLLPKVGYVNNNFAISIKNYLYTLNCKKMQLGLISESCYNFFLTNYYVLFYTWTDSTPLDSYYYYFKTGEYYHEKNLLYEDYVKYKNSFMFQGQIWDQLFPKCYECNLFNTNSDDWIVSNAVIYKDDYCVVKYQVEQDSVNPNRFMWKSLSLISRKKK